MKQNLEKYLPQLFQQEGGFVNRNLKDDPGGATNMGITIGTLSDYRGKKATVTDVKNLTKQEATEIYRKKYWEPIDGDELYDGLDVCVFDFAVHSSHIRAAKYLQTMIGVGADGKIGPKTLKAMNDFVSKNGIENTIRTYNNLRMRFLKGLPNYSANPGWNTRVSELTKTAIKLAND